MSTQSNVARGEALEEKAAYWQARRRDRSLGEGSVGRREEIWWMNNNDVSKGTDYCSSCVDMHYIQN